MKKILVFILLAIIFTFGVSAISDPNDLIKEKTAEFGIDDLQDKVPSDVSNTLEKFNLDEITPENVSSALNFENILNFLSMNFVKTLKLNGKLIVSLIAVLFAVSLFEALKNSYSDKNLTPVFNFAAGVIICIILYKPFYDCAQMAINSIKTMSNFMLALIPVMVLLMTSSGHIATAAVFNSFLFIAVQVATSIAGYILLPIANIYIAIGIASVVTENINLKSVTDFIKSVVNWGIGILLTLFVGILTLQTVISTSADTLSKRTLKFAVGSFLPVAGSILADAVDTFMSCVNILKSTVGVFGIIVMFFIITMPLINIAVNFLTLKISTFLSSLFGNEKIQNLLKIMVDGFGIIMVLTAGVSMMFFISITILIVTGTPK